MGRFGGRAQGSTAEISIFENSTEAALDKTGTSSSQFQKESITGQGRATEKGKKLCTTAAHSAEGRCDLKEDATHGELPQEQRQTRAAAMESV